MNFKKAVIFGMGVLMLISMLATARAKADDNLAEQIQIMHTNGKIAAQPFSGLDSELKQAQANISALMDSKSCPLGGMANQKTLEELNLAQRQQQLNQLTAQLVSAQDSLMNGKDVEVDKLNSEIQTVLSRVHEDIKLACAWNSSVEE